MSLTVTATAVPFGPNDRWIDEKEASRIFGYSIDWFQKSRWLGNGPEFQKRGRSVWYWLPTLIAYFGSYGTRQSTSQPAPDPGPNDDGKGEFYFALLNGKMRPYLRRPA